MESFLLPCFPQLPSPCQILHAEGAEEGYLWGFQPGTGSSTRITRDLETQLSKRSTHMANCNHENDAIHAGSGPNPSLSMRLMQHHFFSR